MKKNLYYLIMICLIVISGISCKREAKIILRLTNPLEIERKGEVITLGNKEFTELTGEIPDNTLPLFLFGKDTLAVQFIDHDKNTHPEEILVEISLGPKETKNIEIVFIPSEKYPVFPDKTNIRFARKTETDKEIMYAERLQTKVHKVTAEEFQMEGPAWENDKVGFRNYFDLRNGMDIFGKRTSEMVLDGIGLGDNYHELSDWGMDILKVGNSLGAGSIGVERNGNLYRIGDNGHSTFDRLLEGPLRNEFRFVFPEWKMESREYFITHYITTTAGQYAYKSTVFAGGIPDNAYVIGGIVNMLSEELFIEESGDYIILFTHAPQAEDQTWLAMALMMHRNYFKGSGEAPVTGPGIIETYYAKMDLDGTKEIEFYFYSLWETSDSRFADIEYVKEYLRNEGIRMSNPVDIVRIK